MSFPGSPVPPDGDMLPSSDLHKRKMSGMGWMKLSMSPDNVGAGLDRKLRSEFDGIWKSITRPRGAAMLRSRANECEYYFTPEAVAVLHPVLVRHGAAPCRPPNPDDVVSPSENGAEGAAVRG